MKISDFKCMATMSHDNTEQASEAWARSWGMDYWRNLWRYKEYTLANLKYRVGRVYTRHYNYPVTEFFVDGQEVKRTAFLKAFNALVEQGVVVAPRPAYVAPAPAQPRAVQLALF